MKTKRPHTLTVKLSAHEQRMFAVLAKLHETSISALVRQWVRGKYHFDVRARRAAGLSDLRAKR